MTADNIEVSNDPTSGTRSASFEWIDNHCHVARVDDLSEVVADAVAAGVVAMVDVSCSVDESELNRTLVEGHEMIWSTVGVHPHEAEPDEHRLGRLAELLDESPATFVGVGECGLDYHYDHSPRDAQRRVFAAQIALAHERSLPLIIHTRSAWDETFAILDSEGVPERTVFHCFSGGPAEAELCVERGALISVSGIVTFPSAGDLRAAVLATPLDRLMVETDSPYLTPVPHRGQRNRPALVPLIGQAVAAVRELSVEDVARSTTATARKFFGLPQPSERVAAEDGEFL